MAAAWFGAVQVFCLRFFRFLFLSHSPTQLKCVQPVCFEDAYVLQKLRYVIKSFCSNLPTSSSKIFSNVCTGVSR